MLLAHGQAGLMLTPASYGSPLPTLTLWFGFVCVVQEGDTQKCKLSRQEAVGGKNEEKGSFRGQGQTLSMFF